MSLCLAQLLSAVLNNAHVRCTFLPVSSIWKFRCCFAANCLHIANVICGSFLYILQLVVEAKCMTRFLPLSLVFFSFELCCMRPHFLQTGSFFLALVNKSLFICLLSGRRHCCMLKTKADQIWIFSNLC